MTQRTTSTMTGSALPQHNRQLNPGNNNNNNKNYRYEIRLLPIILSLALLLGVPLYIFVFSLIPTTLTEDEVKLKLVDTSGSMPVAPRTQGVFKGLPWWNKDRTVDKVILAETPFARCEAHSVMSEDGKTLVKDWLWMEERAHVNVAVLTEGKEFVVMRQKKYGIEGDSLSTVGGFVEEGECPFEAALREVAEELGMGSKATKQRLDSNSSLLNMKKSSQEHENSKDTKPDGPVLLEEATDWIFLGKYRTSTNRGGGFVYDYFLKNAVPIYDQGGTSDYKGTGEGEKQNLFRMTIDQTIQAVKNAEFKEVKWTNALSLSLLQILTGSLDDKTQKYSKWNTLK